MMKVLLDDGPVL